MIPVNKNVKREAWKAKIERPRLADVLMWDRTQELHAPLGSKSLVGLHVQQTRYYIYNHHVIIDVECS